MLLIDDRENSKLINQLLIALGDNSLDSAGQAKVQRMESGDYVIGDLGIEAKEINDLYNSIIGSGRTRTINDQLDDLQNSYKDSMLVVYGTQLKPYIRGKRSRYLLERQKARMERVNLQYKSSFHKRFPKIWYMQFDTMDDFVHFLVSATTKEKVVSVASGRLPRLSKDPRVQALSSLPGISVKIAESLLREFGSLPAMLRKKVTQKELMRIKGVGRQKARMLLRLNESYSK